MRRHQLLFVLSLIGAYAALPAFGQTQTQTSYSGSNATGTLTVSGTTNLMQLSQADANPELGAAKLRMGLGAAFARSFNHNREFPKDALKHTHPKIKPAALGALRLSLGALVQADVTPQLQELNVVSSGGFDFNGLTQMDQRDANGGNQYTVEPPNPSVAVADGYVLEGVNNAVQVYDNSGTALLPVPVSTNELFGLPAAYNRTTGIAGPFPTDMRVFHDQGIDRWMVLQRGQDQDQDGNNLASSHLYLAVSQTADPTGSYNVYTADTTDLQNSYCPCIDDYPQIGADQNGFYISANEMNSDTGVFVDAVILAVSKASLATGAESPTAFRFLLPFISGFEFAVQPATTPPGASSFLADGGLEYFASTLGDSNEANAIAVWAMFNTASLGTNNPALSLIRTSLSTFTYSTPNPASQPDGPIPYGTSQYAGAPVSTIDGGDTRALSLVYSGGRLYLTFSSDAQDQNNRDVVGGALLVLSPTYRAGVLKASILRQTFLAVAGNNVLRPSVAVNPQGVGVIAATVVGPDYFPSAAFIPVSGFSLPTTLYIAGAGTAPEDGFTGYTGGPEQGVARWGDYSTAVAAADGSVWMVSEYIDGNLPRSTGANWDTLITQSVP